MRLWVLSGEGSRSLIELQYQLSMGLSGVLGEQEYYNPP